MNKKVFSIIFFLAVIFVPLFSQNTALAERYLTAANNMYSQQNYAKAFEYINFVYSQYSQDEVPQNVSTLAEEIYYNYLLEVNKNNDEDGLNKISEKLNDNPKLKSKRISDNLSSSQSVAADDEEYDEDDEEEYVARPSTGSRKTARAESSDSKRDAKTQARMEELEKQLEEAKALNQKERQQELEMQKAMYERFISKNSSNVVLFGIISLCIIGIIICAVVLVITVIKRAMNTVQHQQEQFESTLKMVAQLARTQNELSKSNRISTLNAYEICNASEPILLDNDVDESEIEEIKVIAEECRTVGAKIDKVTGRKNHSKNVAETVFKIANELKLSQREAMLYYCAGLIYDIGFLSINESVLQNSTLTKEDKYMIRGHVGEGVYMINFIPEKYKSVFREAILNHHENMDGTGYPAGLVGERIPRIARIIHVSESFVALVSRRNYHTIVDKEKALEILRLENEKYDQSIVDILDSML